MVVLEVQTRNYLDIPIWHKINLTIKEASALSHIGEKELRERTDEPNCPFVLYKGTHKLIKRKKFEEYLAKRYVW